MKTKLILLLVGVLCCLMMAAFVFAGSEAWSVSWWTVDGGGGVSAAGDYQLSGTIGQADAHLEMAGNSYTMAGGYWTWQSSYVSYLPVITTQE